MWNVKKLAVLAAGALFAQSGASHGGEVSGAQIKQVQSDHFVTLQAFAHLPQGGAGRYEFTANKTGPSGTSVTRQAGTVSANPDGGASGPLTTSRLSLRAGEQLIAVLEITTPTGEVLRDQVEIFGID
jgi:hypothetical protein